MATGDSARFGQALSGEATRGTAAGGAPAGRARLGLADVSTDLQAPASEPPPAAFVAWAVAWVVLVLLGGIALFRRREL